MSLVELLLLAAASFVAGLAIGMGQKRRKKFVMTPPFRNVSPVQIKHPLPDMWLWEEDDKTAEHCKSRFSNNPIKQPQPNRGR